MSHANPNPTQPLYPLVQMCTLSNLMDRLLLQKPNYTSQLLAVFCTYRLALILTYPFLCHILHVMHPTHHLSIYDLQSMCFAYLKGTEITKLAHDGVKGDGLHGYSDSSLRDQV
jgi:hypothetical protein